MRAKLVNDPEVGGPGLLMSLSASQSLSLSRNLKFPKPKHTSQRALVKPWLEEPEFKLEPEAEI